MSAPRLYLARPTRAGEPDAVLSLDLPDGDAGIECSLAAMAAMVRHAVRYPTPRLQQEADRIMRDARGSWGTFLMCEGARGLYNRLRDVYQFRLDPAGVELVRAPGLQGQLLATGAPMRADCDDLAVYACAALQLAGVPAVFVTQARREDGPRGPWAHVFPSIMPNANTAALWRVRRPEGGTPPIDGLYPMDAQERVPFGHWPDTQRVQWWAT